MAVGHAIEYISIDWLIRGICTASTNGLGYMTLAGMNDVWLFDSRDAVETLSSRFWEYHAKGDSMMKNMYLLVRCDDVYCCPLCAQMVFIDG